MLFHLYQILFITTFVCGQALVYNIGANSDPLAGNHQLVFHNDSSIEVNALPFVDYLGKNETLKVYNMNRSIEQRIMSWKNENGTTATKIENIVLLNTTDVGNYVLPTSIEDKKKLRRRDDGDSWFSTFCSSAKCNINIRTVTYMYNLLNAVNSLIADLLQSMQIVTSYVKKDSQKKSCSSDTTWVTTRDGGEWQTAISIYTTGENCDATASEDDIRRALEYAVADEEFHNKMAFCVRLDHSSTWHADVRFQRSWNPPFSNIWEMECLSDNNRSYTYDTGCTEDHSKDEL